jgi:hypothetical protein
MNMVVFKENGVGLLNFIFIHLLSVAMEFLLNHKRLGKNGHG